jgi:hypothetical protein
LLLLLARRRKMRREAEAEAEAEAGPGADGDSDGAARRQIRPDCGSRKRGMVVVANAMAVSCLPVWIFPSLVRSERGPIQSIGLVPARDPRRQPCIQHSAEQRTLRCGSIGALASGQKNSMRQWSAAAAASKAALPLRLARSRLLCVCLAQELRSQGAKEPRNQLGRWCRPFRVCPFDVGNHRGRDWCIHRGVGHILGPIVAF